MLTDSQREVDEYWPELSAGDGEGPCGWLKDRSGIYWSIVTAQLPDLIKHLKARQAILQMRNLDIAAPERAAQE